MEEMPSRQGRGRGRVPAKAVLAQGEAFFLMREYYE
jgi:hypothetical protein